MWVGVAAQRSTFDEDGDDLFLSLTLSGRVLKWLELQFLEPLYSSVNTSPAGGICDESAAILLGICMACCWSSSSFWSFPSKLIIVSLPKEKCCMAPLKMQVLHPWLYAADLEDGLKWIHTSKEVDAYPSSASHLPSSDMKEMWIWASPHPMFGVQSLDQCEGEKSLQPLHFVQQPKLLQFLMDLVSRAMFWWQIDKLGSFSAGFVLTLRSSYSRHIFWVWGFDEVHWYLCSYGNIYALHVETTYWGSAWATPPVLNMWPWKLKLDEEKSNHAGLAQQIGFGPAFFAWFAESGKRHSKT